MSVYLYKAEWIQSISPDIITFIFLNKLLLFSDKKDVQIGHILFEKRVANDLT